MTHATLTKRAPNVSRLVTPKVWDAMTKPEQEKWLRDLEKLRDRVVRPAEETSDWLQDPVMEAD